MLKLGCKIAPEQFPPSELLQQVVAAEKAGFESTDASDHFIPGVKRDKPALSGAGLVRQL